MSKDKVMPSLHEAIVFVPSASDRNGNDAKCSNPDIQNQAAITSLCQLNEPLDASLAIVSSTDTEPSVPDKYDTLATLTRRPSWRARFGGVLFALVSAMLFSLVTCFVKLLPNDHAFSIAFWRQFGNVIPSIPLLIYFRCWKKQHIFDHVWPINRETWTNVRGLAFRSILGSTCVILRFYSLNFLTVADSAVIMYGGPIFTIVLAHFFLKEKCGFAPILVGFWSLFGVCVICRPPFLTGTGFDTKLLIGTGISLVIVFLQANVVILVRKVRKIHFAVMTFIFGFWGIVQTGIVAVSFGVLTVPSGLHDISIVVALALCSFVGQMCAILALKFEEAGNVSLVRTSDVIFAFLFQSVLLNVESDIFSIIGACIVLSAVFIVAFRKWVTLQPEKSTARKYFWFLLK